jgi:hypothetical protein
VKSRFQSLPFKCNLQRYIEVVDALSQISCDVCAEVLRAAAGLFTLNQSS